MAVKKSTGATKKGRSAAKTVAKKSAVKKGKAPAKAAAKKAAPKKAAAKNMAAKKTAAKKAAPVKLTERQQDLLRNVHAKQAEGYPANSKAVAKSLEQLQGKKLVKKGAKNKATGHVHYHVSRAGEKHLGSATTAPAAAPAPVAVAPAAPVPPPAPAPVAAPVQPASPQTSPNP